MAAKNQPVRAEDIALQLCEPRTAAFTRKGWLWELKLDGFRALAAREAGKVQLLFRRGRDATDKFAEIAEAVAKVGVDDFILDGELVILDAQGRPVFEKLLERSTLTGHAEIRALSRTSPAVYFAFDLLRLEGKDLRGLPLQDRKALLSRLLPKEGRVRALDHVEEQGEALLEAVREQGLEGVVGKRAAAVYRGGRSADWVKVAFTSSADFAVVGYAEDFQALHLGVRDGHDFVYVGKVGAGFGTRQQEAVRPALAAARRATPPCRVTVAVDKDVVWTDPVKVAEVRYKSWPPGQAPRQPVLLRFRDDKAAAECVSPSGVVEAVAVAEPAVKLSNPKKIYFPAEAIAKEEVFNYYRAVSPWLLPYLRDRPLTITRYPDGITGKNFFQKAKPKGAPDWLPTTPVHNEEDDRDYDQIVCSDLRTLEWVANMGTLPMHLPAGRLPNLQLADWCVIDFDPKDAPFEAVITLAVALRKICDKAGLPTFPKTSGASGLHVMIPLGGEVDHAFAVQLAELLAQLLVSAHPTLATVERTISKRGARVYLDCYQNGNNKLIAAPFCVRARPGAPVSMPLVWTEVKQGLKADQFTIRNAIARLEKRGDPMAPLLTLKPALKDALGKLIQ